MKRILLALTALLAMTQTTSAMSYEQARDQALFLTDKMAYELNLTEDQYEAAYEVNLDYLMGINTYDDLYGTYWTRRNLDLGYILLDWQYQAYCAASYFYRPLYWSAGVWHFGIYARYPHRHYYYFGRPSFYSTYCGGHSWHHNGGRSWYHGRSYGHGHRKGFRGHGMRDGYDRGDYKGKHWDRSKDHAFNHGGNRSDNNHGNRGFGRGNRGNDNNNNNKGFNRGDNGSTSSFGGNRGGNNGKSTGTLTGRKGNTINQNRPGRDFQRSSTRTTVTRSDKQRSEFKYRNESSRPRNTFTPRSSERSANRSGNSSFKRSERSFNRSNNSSRPSRSFNQGSSSRRNNSSQGRSNGGGRSKGSDRGGRFGR